MRLGTRGSALALAQAQPVADALGAELVVIRTSGDIDAPGTAGSQAPPSDKERWVDSIEQALVDGEIDVAVHSAKDVPGVLRQGLSLVAAAGREDPSDALVGADSLDGLPPGARVGTSSARRRAQLAATREDLEILDIRGNVDTRLAKLAAGEVDAIVLATAGLKRLGREREIGTILNVGEFVPAPGQGTLVLEAAHGLDFSAIADPEALAALRIERELARLLGADCNSAVGIHHDGSVTRAWVGKPDGSAWIRDEVDDGDPARLAQRLLTAGAGELLS